MPERTAAGDKGAAADRASSGILLEVAHGFGSHAGKIRDALLFGDIAGQYLAHVVGRQLVFRNLLGGEVGFAAEKGDIQVITACAASRDRSFLAVCRSAMERCSISIYELGPHATNRPVQTLEELHGRDGPVGPLSAVAFSSASIASGVAEDSNCRLCVSSTGHYAQIIVLDWRLNEVIGRFMIEEPLTRIAFSTLDSDIISGTGPNTFELWLLKDFTSSPEESEKLESKEMITLQPVEELVDHFAATFMDHAWLQPANGALAICTEQGAVDIISSGLDVEDVEARAHADVDPVPYFVCHIECPFGQVLAGLPASCIQSFAGGFVVAGAQSHIAVWRMEADEGEAHDDLLGGPSYKHDCTACLALGAGSAVAELDLVGSRDEVYAAVGFENAYITHFRLGILRAGDVVPSSPATLPALEMRSEPVEDLPLIGGGCHSGPVSNLDIAVQRPIVVSACSQDGTIRVWDYQAGECSLCWQATEELTSLALHPFGFLLAVSFSDRIRLMEILAKDLKLFSEINIKNVHLLRFSNGGHVLAAAQAKVIIIFSTRTLKKVATLRGHSREVACVFFDPLDKTMVSVGEDGKVCEWSTENWSSINEYGVHGEALAIATAGEGRVWAGVAESEHATFRSFRNGVYHQNEDIVFHSSEHISSMDLFSRPSEVSILAGDLAGNLLAFCGVTGVLRTTTLGLHDGGITALRISSDGHTVATAGKDGSVFVLNADGFTDSQLSESRRQPMEVVMINRGDIQLRQDEISDLTAQIAKLKTQLEENAARLQGELRARVEEARRKAQATIQSLRKLYEEKQQASTVKERENLRKMKITEALHVASADDEEKAYDKRMRADADSYVALQAELREMEAKFEQNRQQARWDMEQQEMKQEKVVQQRLSEKDAKIQTLKDLIAFTEKRFDAMFDQEGMEQSLEISEIKKKNQEELEQQHLVEYKLKKDQDMLVRALDMMEKDRDRIAMEQREAGVSISNLRSEAELMKREVHSLKVERKERESTLRDKEMEIGTHKVKVQTLKKFKQVLDFRLREVTDSLKPKEDMIAQLHLQLSALEEEFEKQLEIQAQMETVLETKSQQVSDLSAEVEKQKELIRQRERTIFRFSADLHELATGGEDTRNWHIGMKRIWRTHVNPEIFNQDEEQSRPIQELGRQIQVMERKAGMLNLRVRSGETTSKADRIHKAQENSLLICELEELRIEKKALMAQAKDLELRIRLHQQSEEVQAKPIEALPSRSGSEAKSSKQALCDLFEEAPECQRTPMKGTLKKGHLVRPLGNTEKSGHKSQEELRSKKRFLKQVEKTKMQLTEQRIRQQLVPTELQRMQQRKSGEPSVVLSESGSSSAPAGPALAVVRFGSRFTPGSSVDSLP
ncbi:unnamed protein product [Durusdinium trenchii]|uniref:Cilia- and flagella-associated protein 57 n=2 Tax=Durusdinium trenchii TaxID=1381693 RepID=A0ABP0LS37_9DINO